jgi:hypothetical protein
MAGVFERIAAAGFASQKMPGSTGHYVFERDGLLALVEKSGEGFGSVGNPGVMTERGFAVLVWRGGVPVFACKGHELPAGTERVEAARRFSGDLRAALADE